MLEVFVVCIAMCVSIKEWEAHAHGVGGHKKEDAFACYV